MRVSVVHCLYLYLTYVYSQYDPNHWHPCLTVSGYIFCVFVCGSLEVQQGRGGLCCPGCRCRLWAWLGSLPPSSGWSQHDEDGTKTTKQNKRQKERKENIQQWYFLRSDKIKEAKCEWLIYSYKTANLCHFPHYCDCDLYSSWQGKYFVANLCETGNI